MKPLTPEACSQVAQETTKKILFPTLGYEVLVRRLGLNELAAIHSVVGEEESREASDEGDVWITSLAIVDESGNQPYATDDGRKALRLLPPGMCKRISRVALGMIGLDAVALKNS